MRLSQLFLGDDGLEKVRLEKLMVGGESKYLNSYTIKNQYK